jgi:hypothetical protein
LQYRASKSPNARASYWHILTGSIFTLSPLVVVQYNESIRILRILKTNEFKFTLILDPLYGDEFSAKSFEVLPMIFSTDCSPIDWLQSLLKTRHFEYVFLLFFSFFINQALRSRGGELD